jgi:Siphovirus Gp157
MRGSLTRAANLRTLYAKSLTVFLTYRESHMDPSLLIDLRHHELLRQQVVAEFPAIDDETLRDTVEGLTNLPEVLARILRSHLDDLALLAALRSRILDMQERFTRLETRADKKRALVASVMERADIKKLTEPDFTASLRQVSPGLVVIDEREIPELFWRPQPPKLDRKSLLAALNAGQAVPGATLGNGSTTITVRTR